MHGIVGVFGIVILISFALSFIVSLVSGFTTLKSALVTFVILLIIAAALAGWNDTADAVIQLPLYLAGLTIGLFGGLPGAALARWVRHRASQKEY